jgi:hypothetical protein
MKYGQVNYSQISHQLNQNGYKTRNGCSFCPGIVRRLGRTIQDLHRNKIKLWFIILTDEAMTRGGLRSTWLSTNTNDCAGNEASIMLLFPPFVIAFVGGSYISVSK